jgi:RHS repeat-associated protein
MYNKTARVDLLAGGRNQLFAYDSAYRMIQSTGGLFGMVDYALDGVGNRQTVTGTGQDAGTYTLDSAAPEPADFQMNQYTNTPFGGEVHDKNGNLQIRSSATPLTSTMTYDYANRMIAYSASGVNAAYKYDALGRRIEKAVNGSVTHYFYDDWRVIEEQAVSGATLATYVWGVYVDEALSMNRGGQDFFYHQDDLYNVVKLTDAGGAVVEQYEYSDYGAPIFFDGGGVLLSSSSVGNPYLFTGREFDSESALHCYRTRYLDSAAGRFTTRDVLGIWGDLGNLGGAYAYVGNNPFTYVDPYGEAWQIVLQLVRVIVVVIKVCGKVIGKYTVKIYKWVKKWIPDKKKPPKGKGKKPKDKPEPKPKPKPDPTPKPKPDWEIKCDELAKVVFAECIADNPGEWDMCRKRADDFKADCKRLWGD